MKIVKNMLLTFSKSLIHIILSSHVIQKETKPREQRYASLLHISSMANSPRHEDVQQGQLWCATHPLLPVTAENTPVQPIFRANRYFIAGLIEETAHIKWKGECDDMKLTFFILNRRSWVICVFSFNFLNFLDIFFL